MASATPALKRMEDALRDVLDQMAPTDPRRGRVNRNLFRVAGKFGATAAQGKIDTLDDATAEVRKLLAVGVFKVVIAQAEAAVEAIPDPPNG